MADLIYKSYYNMYIIEPGESSVVEATPDAFGLKVGLIYEANQEKQELFFHRFTNKNDSVLTVQELNGLDVNFFGENIELAGRGKLRELAKDPFEMALYALSTSNTNPAPEKKVIQGNTSDENSNATPSNSVEANSYSIPKPIAQPVTQPAMVAAPRQSTTMNGNSSNNFKQNEPITKPLNIAVIPTPGPPIKPIGMNPSPSPSVTTTASTVTTTQNVGYTNNTDEKEKDFKAELDRIKREKKWEEELSRIKAEKKLEEDKKKEERFNDMMIKYSQNDDPHHNNGQTAPVADTSCTVKCIIT